MGTRFDSNGVCKFCLVKILKAASVTPYVATKSGEFPCICILEMME